MLYDYILELRNRTLLIAIMWVSLIVICFSYKETLLFLSIKPNLYLYKQNLVYFIATNLTDILYAYLHLSYFLANQIVALYTIYNIFAFLTPALYKFEYMYLKTILLFILFFWLLGFLVLNSYILPYCWNFFLSFQTTVVNQAIKVHFEAKITEYVYFYIFLHSIYTGISQAFLILFLFLDTRIDKINFIKNSRKFLYFMFFLLATLITPPDIISQIIVGCSFILIYEILLLVIFFKAFLV
jgi:sec-independent protein translocase protein TatC